MSQAITGGKKHDKREKKRETLSIFTKQNPLKRYRIVLLWRLCSSLSETELGQRVWGTHDELTSTAENICTRCFCLFWCEEIIHFFNPAAFRRDAANVGSQRVLRINNHVVTDRDVLSRPE